MYKIIYNLHTKTRYYATTGNSNTLTHQSWKRNTKLKYNAKVHLKKHIFKVCNLVGYITFS